MDSSQQILNIVCNVFDAHSAVLFLPRHGNGNEYSIAAFFSLGDEIQKNAVITPGKGLAGWMIRDRKPLLINNFDQKRGVLGYYNGGYESRVRAFMGCPLDNGMGALCVDSIRTYTFSAKDQKILHQFAQLIHRVGDESYKLKADLDQFAYYKSLQKLSKLGAEYSNWNTFVSAMLSELSNVTGFTYAMMCASLEGKNEYIVAGSNHSPFRNPNCMNQSFPLSNGVIGWVFKKQQKVVSTDGDSSSSLFGKDAATLPFGTIVCLPVKFAGQTRCVIVLANSEPLLVSEEMDTFLKTATENMALLLENLYLWNELEGRPVQSVEKENNIES